VEHQLSYLNLICTNDGLKVVGEYAGRGLSGKVASMQQSAEWKVCRNRAKREGLPIVVINPSRVLRHDAMHPCKNPHAEPEEEDWEAHHGLEIVSIQSPDATNEEQKQFLARIGENIIKLQDKENIHSLMMECKKDGLSSRKTRERVYQETRVQMHSTTVVRMWQHGREKYPRFQHLERVGEGANGRETCSTRSANAGIGETTFSPLGCAMPSCGGEWDGFAGGEWGWRARRAARWADAEVGLAEREARGIRCGTGN
jgi:hypothetical protein